MSMALEVEDVIGQLKAWLTQIEGRLFETDSDTTDLNQLETRLRSIQVSSVCYNERYVSYLFSQLIS